MVGILAQVDDIFSWAPRGGKLLGTRWGMRIQGHGYLNILCRCNIRRSAADQREHGFLLDQHYACTFRFMQDTAKTAMRRVLGIRGGQGETLVPTAVAGGDEGFVFGSEASDNNNSG